MTDAAAGEHWQDPPKTRKGGWLAVLLVASLAITLAGVFPFRQIIAQQRQVDTAQEQLDSLEAQNAALEAEAAALRTPAEIERIAREELGLVRPGERGFAVQTPTERATPEPEASVAEDDDRTVVEKIWDFLTGRDLAPDG